jgi:hypothetical protein
VTINADPARINPVVTSEEMHTRTNISGEILETRRMPVSRGFPNPAFVEYQ